MNLILRRWSLALMASALFACSPHVEGGGGGSGGGSTCPAPSPGLCPPSACINGVEQTGGATCENGQWVCTQVACGGCDGSAIPYCNGGTISSLCCPMDAPCPNPMFCDLGNGACTEGPCPVYADGGVCAGGTISAASYDQACNVAADCVAVYQGDLCSNCPCPNAAINQAAHPAYSAVLANLLPPVVPCDCPDIPPPVCQAGTCVLP